MSKVRCPWSDRISNNALYILQLLGLLSGENVLRFQPFGVGQKSGFSIDTCQEMSGNQNPFPYEVNLRVWVQVPPLTA